MVPDFSSVSTRASHALTTHFTIQQKGEGRRGKGLLETLGGGLGKSKEEQRGNLNQ